MDSINVQSSAFLVAIEENVFDSDTILPTHLHSLKEAVMCRLCMELPLLHPEPPVACSECSQFICNSCAARIAQQDFYSSIRCPFW